MNPTDTEPAQQSGPYRYRPRLYYLHVGLGTLIFFVAMGAGSVVAAYGNFDGSFAHPKTAALVFGLFWSGFAGLSLWLLAAYFRERLRLGPSSITCQGVFRLHRVRLRDVNSVVWRRYPAGGSVVVRTPEKRLKIELANFTRPEQEEIIAYFREAIPTARQEGWEKFVASVRTPRKTSRGAELVPIFGLSAFTAIFVIAGLRRGETGYILLGLLNAAVAVGLVFLRRPSKSSPCRHRW
ncbi:MAG: hypothetical protein WBC44_21910 [Planctomycetaceae bacterium]